MFAKSFISNAIKRSAENPADRRRFLALAGAGVAGAAGASYLVAGGVAEAATTEKAAKGPSDVAVLNFALNLEYLEAEFYSRAVYGEGLSDRDTDAKDKHGNVVHGGPVVGGRKVRLTGAVRDYACEIANDEIAHVKFLRSKPALGSFAVSRPAIDLRASFNAAAKAAGLISGNQTFDPFADENSFLLGAFIFEDVGVTAYKGSARLLSNKNYLEAAAGILAVEAYHASTIRTTLLERGLVGQAQKISDARDSLDGASDLDQGIIKDGRANIVPTDANGIAFSRSAEQVLNIVYLNPKNTTQGGFFPHGVNGEIRESGPKR